MSHRITKDTFTKFQQQTQHIQLNWYHNGTNNDILSFNPNGTFKGLNKIYDAGNTNEWYICNGGINNDNIDKLCIGPIGIKNWIENENGAKNKRPHGYYKEFDLPLSLNEIHHATLKLAHKRSCTTPRAIQFNKNSVSLIKIINKCSHLITDPSTGEIFCHY